MSKYLGDLGTDFTLDFKFTTVDLNQSPTTFGASPALTVFKSNGTEQSASGVILTEDFDGTTGLNHVQIVGTDAFYAPNEDYDVVVDNGTVGGTSLVGMVVRSFSVQNRFQDKQGFNVSSGTVDRVSSVGTSDLSLAITNLTFDGTRVNVNLEAVNGIGTCDTRTWENAIVRILSGIAGPINRSGDDYNYRDQAGSNTLFTLTSTLGSRTLS